MSAIRIAATQVAVGDVLLTGSVSDFRNVSADEVYAVYVTDSDPDAVFVSAGSTYYRIPMDATVSVIRTSDDN